MVVTIYTADIIDIEAVIIRTEVDVSNGLPFTKIIGCTAGNVKEADNRVKSAIKNSGFKLNSKKTIINLSPAFLKKNGSIYDMSIAVGILAAHEHLKFEDIETTLFIGELSLDGNIRDVDGVVAIAVEAKKQGFKRIFTSINNAYEAAVVKGIDCIGVKNLNELIKFLEKKEFYRAVKNEYNLSDINYENDFSDIIGNEFIKRAAIIAAAGRHSMLITGPAGTGKTMLAKRILSILPQLSDEEFLEVSKIYSISKNGNYSTKIRPFRSPHHTINTSSLIGGRAKGILGEVSLADKGVLFIDEFANCRQDVIDSLRQVLENKSININIRNKLYTLPTDFMLIAASNPCKCGYYPDRTKCKCSEAQVKRYLSRLSKPVIDRIDICVQTKIQDFEIISGQKNSEGSEIIRRKVITAREIQEKRFKPYNIKYNSEMDRELIDIFCRLDEDCRNFISLIFDKRKLSARSYKNILCVARTIADYCNEENIRKPHLSEALSYRCFDEEIFY